MKSPVRVLIVDDHFVVRKGVCALLAGAADITVVGEADDGRQAVEEAGRCDPQVILMDLQLPEVNGVEAIRKILAVRPEVGIVVLTGTEVEADVLTAISAGALGYLAKTSRREDFLEAIRQVSRGEAWLPPRLTRKLLTYLKLQPAYGTRELLTDRENEVLALLARGWSNRSIARELSIGEVTVRTHVSHILDKLGVSNRVEATLYALRSGLVQPESS
ncbi:MAG TPA: response regulator transcription factor [Thermoanaerobaculia bacterium]|nr:response regulator transcription factor [Thermoanaerobaculia bacterium]